MFPRTHDHLQMTGHVDQPSGAGNHLHQKVLCPFLEVQTPEALCLSILGVFLALHNRAEVQFT